MSPQCGHTTPPQMGAAMGVRKRAAPKAVPVAVPVYDASIARAFDRELPRTPRGTVDVRAARGDEKFTPSRCVPFVRGAERVCS